MASILVISQKNTHPDGVQIGVEGEQIGFYGAAPVYQRSGFAGVEWSEPTYEDPDAGTVNSGDATTDGVINSLRTQLAALAADVAAGRTLTNELRATLVGLGFHTGQGVEE